MKTVYIILSFILSAFKLDAQINLINLVPFSSGYYQPLDIENCGDSRLFIVQQNGKIYICTASGKKKPKPYLNISNRVDTTRISQGLLGLAFDPGYTSNGFFYVNYINKSGYTQISRFKVSAGDSDIADASSEKFILQVQQPFPTHNGGCIKFGPDGYLYIGTGDGDDLTGDPNNYAQNTQSFLGKMLRIDVHHGDPYKVPIKNPFVNTPGYLSEIWAIGMRNPWRWSFDALTHNLIIADVGQHNWEEVNLQPADSKGGENYGWRCYEGNKPFDTTGCQPKKKYTFPIAVYNHSSNGDCAITGGFVYRGNTYSELYGKYFYADYCSGIIRMFDIDSPLTRQNVYYGNQHAYTSFGENKNHELYITNFADGKIYRITSAPALQQKTYNLSTGKVLQPVKIYPNPARGNFFVFCNVEKGEEYTLRLYTPVGNESLIIKRQLKKGANTWNIAVPQNCKGNCYFTISSPAGIFITQKVFIE